MKPNKFFVAIGTKNPSKIDAVSRAFKFLFTDPKTIIEYQTYSVDSGVGNQPVGLESIINGAITRAKLAYEQGFLNKPIDQNQCFGVGIESGLVPISNVESGYMDFQFAAIFHKNKITLGCSSAFEYPKSVITEVFDGTGKEIGDIMEKMSGIQSLKQKEGAIGFLTNGKIKRKDILKNGVLMALLPIINKTLYSS